MSTPARPGVARSLVRKANPAPPLQSLCIGGTQYTTAQDDEFSQDTTLDAIPTPINVIPWPSAMWSTMFSFGRTNNAGADDAFYTDATTTPYYSPFSLSNGALNIEAAPVPQAHLGDPLLQGRHWLSGVLEGKPLTYGYVEVSAIEPNLQGFWPAPIWLLGYDGADGKGNGYSELDGNEIFGNALGTSVVQQTQILGNNPRTSNYVRSTVAPDPGKNYHTYGILWTPSRVSFYIDRVPTSRAFTNAATGPMNPLIILQVFTQTTWAPGPATRTPQYLNVKYYRWYQNGGTGCSPTVVTTPPPNGPLPTPTPIPQLPPEKTNISIVQKGPVSVVAAWQDVTATLPAMPRNGDMLLLASAVDNTLTPPTGWKWLNGPNTLNIMYGIVGQNGLGPATSYDFVGYTAVAQLLEISGMSQTIAPTMSADPQDYGLSKTRTLTVPAAGGLGLVVWGARSDTASGGLSSITDWPAGGEAEQSLTQSINNAFSGSALSLAISQVTTDPFACPQPFSVTGKFVAGNAPNLTSDGYVVWIHP